MVKNNKLDLEAATCLRNAGDVSVHEFHRNALESPSRTEPKTLGEHDWWPWQAHNSLVLIVRFRQDDGARILPRVV